MNAKKESCPTKMALMAEWHTAAENYSKSVADLSRKIGILPQPDYEEMRRKAEQARERSVAAQRALDAHIQDHGCDGNGEVAA